MVKVVTFTCNCCKKTGFKDTEISSFKIHEVHSITREPTHAYAWDLAKVLSGIGREVDLCEPCQEKLKAIWETFRQ